MTGRKNRNGKALQTKFALPLLLAAVAALALWLASLTPPPAQAQASCGSGPLNGRTQAVVDAILDRLSETDCSAVNTADLNGITGTLDLSSESLTSLQSDDFDGLTSLVKLDLEGNALTALPVDVFDGLTSLEELVLEDNALTALPSDVFDGLTSLEQIFLEDNSLAALPEDVFDGLTTLNRLNLFNNSLTELPSDVFGGLDSLTNLLISGNQLAALPSDVFDGLSNLEVLFIGNNPLVWLPPDLFDGLSSLQQLRLNSHDTNFTPAQSLACIHAGQFDGLAELQDLRLGLHQLGNIDPSHFTRWNLGKLEELRLGTTSISSSPLDFATTYDTAALPALEGNKTWVVDTADLTDPICGEIKAETDNGFSGTGMVRVLLEEGSVRPNRARVIGTSGDGVCGSDPNGARHQLWTWQRSADGVTWTDTTWQPPDYGSQGRRDGECSFLYTPQSDDNGMYVRAYVPVTTTGLGENDYHSAAYGPLNVQ